MDYLPFFGMNILVSKSALSAFYVAQALFFLLLFFYFVLTLVLLSNMKFRGGKDA